MNELFKALAAFQQECPAIEKNTKGYSYKYADLPSILKVISPLLKKHGLGFTQALQYSDDTRKIQTILFHVDSGKSWESVIDVPIVEFKGMNDYQALGSGITYLRRYALSSLLGIVTDEDIDAAGEQVKKDIGEKRWIGDKEVESYVSRIKEGEFNHEDFDVFMIKLRTHFKVNKKHAETLRTEFEFQKTLSL